MYIHMCLYMCNTTPPDATNKGGGKRVGHNMLTSPLQHNLHFFNNAARLPRVLGAFTDKTISGCKYWGFLHATKKLNVAGVVFFEKTQ